MLIPGSKTNEKPQGPSRIRNLMDPWMALGYLLSGRLPGAIGHGIRVVVGLKKQMDEFSIRPALLPDRSIPRQEFYSARMLTLVMTHETFVGNRLLRRSFAC
jgi:hypothetical protein